MHFLLYTDEGSLVMVLAASALVAFVVWWAVTLTVAAVAFAVLRLRTARRRRVYSPGGKA